MASSMTAAVTTTSLENPLSSLSSGYFSDSSCKKTIITSDQEIVQIPLEQEDEPNILATKQLQQKSIQHSNGIGKEKHPSFLYFSKLIIFLSCSRRRPRVLAFRVVSQHSFQCSGRARRCARHDPLPLLSIHAPVIFPRDCQWTEIYRGKRQFQSQLLHEIRPFQCFSLLSGNFQYYQSRPRGALQAIGIR